MEWTWDGVGVSEEVVGSGNGSSCMNPGRGAGRTGVRHMEQSEALVVGLPSELPWVVGRARDPSVTWVGGVSEGRGSASTSCYKSISRIRGVSSSDLFFPWVSTVHCRLDVPW